LKVAQLKKIKFKEAKHMSTHGLGPILIAHKMTTLHSTIKCPRVFLENAPQIPLFSTSKLHFEKGFKTQLLRQ